MEILILLGLGFLGVIGHSLMKANSLQKDAKVANVPFTFKDYLSNDWLGIALSFVAVLVWVGIYGEVAKKYPAVETFVRCSFAVIGFFGSYIIQTISSRGKNYIRNIVDTKTDKADGVKKE